MSFGNAAATIEPFAGYPARMRRTVLLAATTLSMASAQLGCGSDAECAIDTDCPVFSRCEANRCVPLGAVMDAGMREGGAGEAGLPDGSAPDAPMVPDAGPPILRTGRVSAQSSSFTLGTVTTSNFAVVAGFNEGYAPPPSTCTTAMMAECSVTRCPAEVIPDAGVPDDAGEPDAGVPDDAGPAPDAGPPPIAPHASTIMVTGGAMDVTLMPDALGAYAPVSGASSLWAGGETLTYQALGATVPAFSAMLTAPPHITVIAPAFSVAARVTIDRTMPLTARWTGGSMGTTANVVVSVTGVDAAAGTVVATCTYAAPAGEGTIPLEVIGLFAVGDGTFTVSTSTSTMAEPGGGWMVTLSASSIGARTGGLATGIATFM